MLSVNELEELRDIKIFNDSDDIRCKEIIKDKLYKNKYIIHFLNNEELDEECPDEYLNKNILPYYAIPNIQSKIRNFICYDCSFDKAPSFGRANEPLKNQKFIFYILCHVEDIIDEETGIARHDLLSYFIINEFINSNCFGSKLNLITDKPSLTDNGYVTRTLIFENTTPNSITHKNIINNNTIKR